MTNMGTQVEALDTEVKATKFMWVMWADDELGNGISADATGKLYIGTAYNKPTIEGSLIATDYVWKKIVGDNADNPITLSLTADRHSVPTLSDGTGGDYDMARSTLTVLNGGTIDTANWIVTVNVSAGVEGLLTGYKYKVNNITNDTGEVEFVATQGGIILKKTFTVTKEKQGADGEHAYVTNILSSNGERFYKNTVNSILTARLMKGSEDITDSTPDAYFLWRRVSNDSDADIVWNNNHAGVKQITITSDDVYAKAVFNCDVLG